jgi:hypothetical protein
MADTEQQDNTYGNDQGMTMPTNVEPSQTGSSGGTSESALRIQQLHAVEKVLGRLLISFSILTLMLIAITANCTADSDSR